MNVTCQKCSIEFDDADRSTICPHDLIMPAKDIERKKAALKLLGKYVSFHHMPEKSFFVESCSWNGMISVSGMVGEFAPHLFVVKEPHHG